MKKKNSALKSVVISLLHIVSLLQIHPIESFDLSYDDFAPIGCNEDTTDCKAWSSLFSLDNEELVEISCGDCVTMGEYVKEGNETTVIKMNKGLDIHGTLYIPTNTAIEIHTKFVIVQGKLVIESEKEVSWKEDVKILLQGTKDHILVPTLKGQAGMNNTKACMENPRLPDEVGCNIGKKAFAVAGGTLDINAYPDKCPTWVNLMDNVLSPKPVVSLDSMNLSPPEGCALTIFKADFNDGGVGTFTSSLGTTFGVFHPDDENVTDTTDAITVATKRALYEDESTETIAPDFFDNMLEGEEYRLLSNATSNETEVIIPTETIIPTEVIIPTDGQDGTYYFKTSGRKASFQGPGVDLRKLNLAKCILPNTDYMFRMTARLTNTTRLQSNCFESGKDCLKVMINSLTNSLASTWKTIYYMPPGAAVPDGEWFSVVGYINFGEIITEDMLYQNFYICGPEPGIDISLDNIELSLPHLTFPSKEEVCDQMVTNGDAEADTHPHPIMLYANPEAYVSIGIEDNGNKYFKVRGRRQTWAGLQAPMNLECVDKYVEYRYTARIWLQSEEEELVTFALKYSKPDGAAGFKVRPFGTCKPTSKYTGWTTCSQPFMFTEEFNNVTFVDFFFRSINENSDLWIDDVSISLVKTPVQSLIVPNTVLGCWGAGSQILTTSHTLKWQDAVVSEIVDVTALGDDYAVILLNDTMKWHTTYKQSSLTAVEVALLSRNVLIMGDDTDDIANEKHGGHLMILQTPNVKQRIQGVEFRKMGQQGNLGKYPIHYHLGQNNPGSIIAKNTIRDSHQRCLVIHNTHNVTISWNVAYDTFGHCFMTEDGIEQDNLFEFNLGANTHEMPDEGVLSIAESDMFAATYWISSPTNMFLNNVAAGGEDTGFWYEMLEMVRGKSTYWDRNFTRNPTQALYGFNIGTVVHSNKGDGFKVYPNGYFPKKEAAFKDFRAYLNKGDGVLLHNSANLAVEGGYFADNRQGVEVDKQADAVRVSNGHFVGFSKLFQDIATSEITQTHCPANRPLVGIQIHSFLRYRDSRGYLVEGCKFEMFGEKLTGCEGSSAMNVDPQVRDTPPHYDAYATFRNNTYEKGIPMNEKFDACKIAWSGVIDMAIYDQTGDLNPVSEGTPGHVVSNHSIMSTFAPKPCHDMVGSCALYCEDTCYRTVNIATHVDESLTEVKLRATRTNDGVNTDFYSYFEYMTEDGTEQVTINGRNIFKAITVNSTNDNYFYTRRRYFSAILPYGDYELQFYKNNTPFFPKFAELVFDDAPECTPYIDNTTITFITPPIEEEECKQLIKNNGVETGTFEHWQHAGGSMSIAKQGYLSQNSLRTLVRTGSWHGLGQWIDIRCLVEGQQFEITGRYKLLNEGDKPTICDIDMKEYSNPNVCPRVSIRLRHLTGDWIGQKVLNTYLYPVAEALSPITTTDWNFIYGVLTVTAEMANASTAFIWVERYGVGKNMMLDAFSAVPVVRTCADADFNRGVESGDLAWWKTFGQTKLEIVEPGYGDSKYALKASKRKQFWSSMASIVKPDCLTPGQAFKITAKFKLSRGTDDWDCIPGRYWGPLAFQHDVCPTLAVRFDKGGESTIRELGVVTEFVKGEWNDVFGVFIATTDMRFSDSMFAWFTKFHYLTDITLDDFSIQPEPGVGCDLNILHNGDFNYGDTRSWSPFFAGIIETYSYTDSDGKPNIAGAYIESRYWHEGVGQKLDRMCLDTETEFEAEVDVMLFEDDKTTPYACDPTIKIQPTKKTMESSDVWRCPVIALATQNPGTFPKFVEIGAVSGTTWDTTGWNKMTGTFKITEEQNSATKMWIEIHNTKPGLTIVVDNFLMRKVQTPAPTGSPTEAIEDFIIDSNITYTKGNSVGPNIGANNDYVDFTLSPDGNWTFQPLGNDTQLTFPPDQVDTEDVDTDKVILNSTRRVRQSTEVDTSI